MKNKISKTGVNPIGLPEKKTLAMLLLFTDETGQNRTCRLPETSLTPVDLRELTEGKIFEASYAHKTTMHLCRQNHNASYAHKLLLLAALRYVLNLNLHYNPDITAKR